MAGKRMELLSQETLRHAEYYGMQETFDDLYARSKAGENFTNLMDIILSKENILLAYRNIKANQGSNTPGTDGLTIRDIGRLTPDEVVQRVLYIIQGTPHGYRPKPVRRKEIPKPYDPTKTRPLGIPCIWDRLIQQCVKQVMEPICEAKFSKNSYGFRPNCSAENAIAEVERLVQRSHLYQVIEFDIKGFFDNVNHSKLIRQIWALGIHDKHLIYVLRKALTAPIKLENGQIVIPDKGSPQGGIISPLLANIVLNELDHWIDSQWQENPVTNNYSKHQAKNGTENCGHGYRAMRTTRLKEIYIIRYADDFRVFCKTLNQARRTKVAITRWLWERLKLEVSEEKTRIVNVKRQYSNFLGFKYRAYAKKTKQGVKHVIMSHIADKNLEHARQKLMEQAKQIARPRKEYSEAGEIHLYNSIVMGIQNYYCIATHISSDCSKLSWAVNKVLYNRLKHVKGGNPLVKAGRKLTDFEKERYGISEQLRFVVGSQEPIYPIGFSRNKHPMSKKRSICSYSAEGRKEIHDTLRINTNLMLALMRQPLYMRSMEYADNRISLFSAQWGKCAVTGAEFHSTQEIHCHHKTPKQNGGSDKYDNLVLVREDIHQIIHATNPEKLEAYKASYQRLAKQNPTRKKEYTEILKRINELRKLAGLNVM